MAENEVPLMTHIEEEKVTTTTVEEVEPPKPEVVNLNVNTGGDTITVETPDETPDQTGATRTTTTHTEVRHSE